MKTKALAICILALLLVTAGSVWLWFRLDSVPDRAMSGLSTSKAPTPVTSGPSATPKGEPENSTSIPTETEARDDGVSLTQRLEEIQNDPDALERPGLLLDLMSTASMDEVQALLAASDGAFGDSPAFRDEMKAAAYERWYAHDPAGALRAIDGSTMSTHRKISVMEVFLEDWSGRAPDRVSAFLEERELEGVPTDNAYGAIARGASLAGAVALVNSSLSRIEDPKLQSYAVRAAARILQRDHDPLFEDWLAALPASHQGAALAESAWILSKGQIDRSLANLKRLEQLDAEKVPVTRARVVVKWAEEDPGKAADWVATRNLQGEEREALFANLLSVWISDDRDVAMAWVETLIGKGEIDEAFMNRVAGRL